MAPGTSEHTGQGLQTRRSQLKAARTAWARAQQGVGCGARSGEKLALSLPVGLWPSAFSVQRSFRLNTTTLELQGWAFPVWPVNLGT